RFAFVGAHVIELGDGVFEFGQDGSLDMLRIGFCSSLHGSGHLEDGIQVRFGAYAVFTRGGTEGVDITAYNLAGKGEAVGGATFEREGELDMAAREFFLEQATYLHF